LRTQSLSKRFWRHMDLSM